MASIDPTEEPIEGDDKPFVTLKIIRDPLDVLDDEDDEEDELEDLEDDDIQSIRRRLGLPDELDSDDDMDEDEDDEEEELTNGGPSDPEKVRKAREAALLKALEEDDEDMDLELLNGINGKVDKGKGRASGSDDDSIDTEDFEDREFVVCTLDITKVCIHSISQYSC
jgi:FK506-binding nuclear protein